jgi:FkbM family methyltransferase
MKIRGALVGILPALVSSQRPCMLSMWEPVFSRIIASLFADKTLLHQGSVVDCGANAGGESCHYADLDPTRTVHAIEPLLGHHAAIERYQVNRSNIMILHGGLGSKRRIVQTQHAQRGSMVTNLQSVRSFSPDSSNSSNSSSWTFTVYRLDDLFSQRWRDERLAFAHFDVEGAEADVLLGGMETLRRDRPIFTVEMEYHHRTTPAALFAVFNALGYQAYLVHEVSGVYHDARNLLVVPVERRAERIAALGGGELMAAVYNATHFAHLASTAPTSVRGILCTGEADVLRALRSMEHGHKPGTVLLRGYCRAPAPPSAKK